MKGQYNGVSVKSCHILPVKLNAQLHDLSKIAQLHLQSIDWYYGHDKNSRLTRRHFGISPSVFYRQLTRLEKGNKRFITLEDKSRKPHKVRTPTIEKNIIDLVVQTRKKKNMNHYFIYPNCPKQNGRVKRLNQTAQYESQDYQEDLLPKLNNPKQKAKEWNTKYDMYKPHQALGYKTSYAYYMDWLEKHPAESRCSNFGWNQACIDLGQYLNRLRNIGYTLGKMLTYETNL